MKASLRVDAFERHWFMMRFCIPGERLTHHMPWRIWWKNGENIPPPPPAPSISTLSLLSLSLTPNAPSFSSSSSSSSSSLSLFLLSFILSHSHPLLSLFHQDYHQRHTFPLLHQEDDGSHAASEGGQSNQQQRKTLNLTNKQKKSRRKVCSHCHSIHLFFIYFTRHSRGVEISKVARLCNCTVVIRGRCTFVIQTKRALLTLLWHAPSFSISSKDLQYWCQQFAEYFVPQKTQKPKRSVHF